MSEKGRSFTKLNEVDFANQENHGRTLARVGQKFSNFEAEERQS